MKQPILELVTFLNRDSYDACDLFTNMVCLQRNVDFQDIHTTFIVICEKLTTSLKDHYKVPCDIVHVGDLPVAKAYNQRILKTQAPWIMFMDCGDFFPDVYSLSMILNLLPTDEYDILWTERYDESVTNKGETWTNVVDDIDRQVWGKLFRTQYLLENGIFFDEEVAHDAGDVFLMTSMSRTNYTRFVKIRTRFVPYAHVRTPEKDIPEPMEIIRRHHETNMDIIRNVGKKDTGDLYTQCVMRAICEAYYSLHMEPFDKVMNAIAADVRSLCTEKAELIRKVKPNDMEVFLDEAQEKALAICNKAYVAYGHEMYFDVDGIPFTQWMNRMTMTKKNPVTKSAGRKVTREADKGARKKDHVAVFCGTRNVYDSMEMAAKSLMYHTKMDRVYFLIEDDEFPRELPEAIRCINVSGQKWFDPNGKNYKNSWTWMCMMRAAFAKLLPEEHQVLSLDIDVVVNDDVSELWDINLKDCYFAGVPETMQTKEKKTTYCNFGVIMMNLDRIRETGIDDVIIASLNRDKWGCPEQDAFNHFCAGKIFAIDSKYNATRTGHITADTEEEKISHYAGIKYWKQFKPFRRFAVMSWDDVMKGAGR